MQNFANKPNKLGGKSSIYDSHSYYMAITGPCNVGRENETVSDRGWNQKGHSPPQPCTLSQPGHTIKCPTPPTIYTANVKIRAIFGTKILKILRQSTCGPSLF